MAGTMLKERDTRNWEGVRRVYLGELRKERHVEIIIKKPTHFAKIQSQSIVLCQGGRTDELVLGARR